ncbi:biotin/lipoyl-containing protein [uncultured Megamonas sp.]|uniref:biotin/lipoyl-containing protein n=1 Tax=uncultured Megamonas sp. TaxID=286140 RepID=UPI0025F571C7|nr:biotin/lipoyl-containing protein [uncultured Megamonas sp.]
MKRQYLIVSVFIALVLLLTTVGWAMENKQVEQKAVLAGTVSSTIAEGTSVKMGDSLVEISTLTGTSAAARATVNGVVKQVLVKVGDNITPNQVVVYVEQIE